MDMDDRRERHESGRHAWCIAVPAAAMRRAPERHAEQVSQALFGEGLEVLETAGAWRRVRLGHDGYEGWVEAAAIERAPGPVSHVVAVPSTLLFPAPDIKSSPVRPLYMGGRLTARPAPENERFLAVRLPGGGTGFVIARHTAPAGRHLSDPAEVAERLLHAPYLWGGRTVAGIDCSGLVQLSLMMCGHGGVPRDSGDQMETVGEPLPVETAAAARLRRGDLVFWKGHVAMALGAARIIHANAHHMMVAIEPVRAAIERIEASGGGPVLAVRRPLV